MSDSVIEQPARLRVLSRRRRHTAKIINRLAHWSAVRYAFAVCLVACLPVIVRLLLLPILPIPAPSIHDEFSNLLAADTFIHGRLTNPTPPACEHLETFHELLRPTYSSVYPPGLGILLAVSTIFLGHPWYGVLLSVPVMCIAIMWMLRAWFAPLWTLFAGLLIGLQFGIVHYWVNGYWGGTLPAIGGALLIGAYGRLRRSLTTPCAIAYAAGAAVLLSTRTYEGAVLILTVSGALLWSLKASPRLRPALLRVATASLILVTPVVAFMAAQNRAVTGNMLLLPHELFRQQYGVLPTFAWQPPKSHSYDHRELRVFFEQWEPNLESANKWGTLDGIIPCIWARLEASGQFVPQAIYFPIALLSLAASFFKRMRFLGLCLLTALLANSLVNWLTSHYLAPVLGAMIAVHVYFLRYLRVLFRRRSIGQCAFILVVATLAVSFGIRFYTKTGIPADKIWAYQREDLIRHLSATPQHHIIFVRYSPSHDVSHEWVFNGADVQDQKVIWARYMSPETDQRAASLFGDRMKWLLEPDKSITLRPYNSPPLSRP